MSGNCSSITIAIEGRKVLANANGAGSRSSITIPEARVERAVTAVMRENFMVVGGEDVFFLVWKVVDTQKWGRGLRVVVKIFDIER